MSAIYRNFRSNVDNDSWVTPKSAWEQLVPYISKERTIWEAFYCDGSSGRIWEELGYNVIHKPYPEYDFFKYESENYDVIVSNPPVS